MLQALTGEPDGLAVSHRSPSEVRTADTCDQRIRGGQQKIRGNADTVYRVQSGTFAQKHFIMGTGRERSKLSENTDMLRTRMKRLADQGERIEQRLRQIEAAIVALDNDDLLDLADIFKARPDNPIRQIAQAEMARRAISL